MTYGPKDLAREKGLQPPGLLGEITAQGGQTGQLQLSAGVGALREGLQTSQGIDVCIKMCACIRTRTYV